MQTLIQDAPNSIGYIRCGEILKSQKGFQDPYILRCMQCKEIYLLLESFIFHLNDSCRKPYETKKKIQENVNSPDEAQVINEPLECEEPPVKLEYSSAQMEDPLIVVKNERDIDESFIKIEPSNFDDIKTLPLEMSIDLNSTNYLNVDLGDNNQNGESSLESDESESHATEPEKVEVTQKSYNTNSVSSSFVSTFMKSEENLTVLIAAFRDQPQLWDKTMPNFGNKLKRREYMMKIAEDLNINHNINISGSQVSAVIVHLYRKFQDDIHRVQERDDIKRPYIKPWYLTQLNFIQPHLENQSLEILDSNHHPNLSSEQIVQILEIYKNLPHLWNSDLIENYCKNKRHESILEMLKQLEINMNVKISENTLEQYIRTIHNYFSREKRRILNIKKSEKANNIEGTASQYYQHLKFLYNHAPPLRCSVCGGESISPLHFKMHTSSHDGTMPFTCSQCNKTFKRVNVYTSHAKRHFEDLNYICKECGKKFVNYTNLRLHMRIHTGDKPYCCEMCGDSFRFLQTLSNHRRRHEKRYLHTCNICSQGFYSKMRHDDHMNSHMNIRSYICDICSKAFITKRALKQHKVVHEDVRNYSCKLCGKTFKHKTGVNQHMKTHDIATTEERSIL